MTLEFKLEEADFLEFQLYTASKSDRIRKRKRNGWILFPLVATVLSIRFFWIGNINMGIYFSVIASAAAGFYPLYFKWRYKGLFKKFIRDNYSARIGEKEVLEFRQKTLFIQDKTGEGEIKLKEIERVTETANHFFIGISSGTSLIIPKKELDDVNGLRQKFHVLKLKLHEELDWAW